jgi:putative flavoprotein involved in K+ transport
MKRMVEADKKMIEDLKSIGYKWDQGEDDTGHQMKYRRRCGGYYLDAGCARLMIDREIGLLHFDTIERFVPEGALLKDGTVKQADLLVLATGYHTQQEMVRRLLGDEVADRVGQVWGIGPDGEMANMWKRTRQEGLWFMGGGLTQSRIYSKYVALQIKAIELGYITAVMPT